MLVGLFTSAFRCSVITSLPSDIHTFTFGDEFNDSIDNMKFPRDFRVLRLGDCFNRDLQNVATPPSRQPLTFGKISTKAWTT